MKHSKLVFKVLLSTGLLTYLVLNADTNRILELLGNIWQMGNLIYVLSALLLFALSIFIFAIRWQILLVSYGYNLTLWSLYKYYIIGTFFNNFLPTAIGGDIVRIYKVIQDIKDRDVGFASVMTERITGMAGTLTMTIAALFIMAEQLENNMLFLVATALFFVIGIFFIFIFYPRFTIPLNPVIDRLKILQLGERIHKFVKVMRQNNDNKSVYWKLWITSIAGQILIITMTYLLSLGLSLQITPGYLFLVVPITFLITMLPSINGLGVREGGYVFFLGRIGISKAAALSLSFLVVLVPMLFSLFGGILFLADKKKIKLGEIQNAET